MNNKLLPVPSYSVITQVRYVLMSSVSPDAAIYYRIRLETMLYLTHCLIYDFRPVNARQSKRE